MIFLPVALDPVNVRRSTSGCAARAVPTVLPSPGTTLNTPGGTPACNASSARRNAEKVDNSDGLSTRQFPVASAGAIFWTARTNGKFQPMTPPTTPLGQRMVSAIVRASAGTTDPQTLSA